MDKLPALAKAAAAAIFLCSCGAGGEKAEAPEPLASMTSGGVTLLVEDGFVRPVLSEGGTTAGYLTLRADEADALTGAVSQGFGIVEMHTVIEEDGLMRMRPIEAIDLPPGETVRLEPGGNHLMMFDARAPLAEGETVPVLLEFASGKSVEVDLPVKQPAID
jgi:copper(I)-binding protein